MERYAKAIQNLIMQFSRLPGIGPKTAERLVFYLLEQPTATHQAFADALLQSSKQVVRCTTCCNFSQTSPCSICAETKRNRSVICVVAHPQDVAAIEKTGQFDGCYHVLGGTLDALEGRTHNEIRVRELLIRIKNTPEITEVILALNPDIQGETTILYLTKLLKECKLSVSRLARGLPIGGDVEFTDEVTLTNALRRREQL